MVFKSHGVLPIETAYLGLGGEGNTLLRRTKGKKIDRTHDNTFNYLHSSKKKLTISNELFAGGINEQGAKPKVKKKHTHKLYYI